VTFVTGEASNASHPKTVLPDVVVVSLMTNNVLTSKFFLFHSFEKDPTLYPLNGIFGFECAISTLLLWDIQVLEYWRMSVILLRHRAHLNSWLKLELSRLTWNLAGQYKSEAAKPANQRPILLLPKLLKAMH
jgi:hypothetical protein